VRLFVGVPVAGEARAKLEAALDRWRREYPRTRWEIAEDLHITLQFLGNWEAGRVQELIDALATIAAPRFTVRVAGLKKKGVLWAEVETSPHLERLAEEVMRRTGVAREERPYRPHITLARAREKTALPCEPDAWGACPVTGFDLYETLAPGSRPRYRIVHRFA